MGYGHLYGAGYGRHGYGWGRPYSLGGYTRNRTYDDNDKKNNWMYAAAIGGGFLLIIIVILLLKEQKYTVEQF